MNQRPRPGQREPRPCNRPKGARYGAPFSLNMSSPPEKRPDVRLVTAELLELLDRSSPNVVI